MEAFFVLLLTVSNMKSSGFLLTNFTGARLPCRQRQVCNA